MNLPFIYKNHIIFSLLKIARLKFSMYILTILHTLENCTSFENIFFITQRFLIITFNGYLLGNKILQWENNYSGKYYSGKTISENTFLFK